MHINPYLSFDGTCREAFDFYHRCLGGDLQAMIRFDEVPDCGEVPPAAAGRIAHARLLVDGHLLMGSDAMGHEPFQPMQGVNIAINVDTPQQAERLFDTLSDGGRVTMPLAEMSWAQRFGMFTDRFGIAWMINCEKEDSPCGS